MAKVKSEMSKWCMVRNNDTLRILIKRRMEEENLSMQAISDRCEINYDAFRQYLKKYSYKKGLTQWDVMQVASLLGIQIGLKIELK
jgi:hypothetical protein